MIRIRQLQALEVVLMHPTLTAAADAFRITQPAMSRLIAQLEDDVGFVLINRSDGQIRLTPKGEEFWDEARRVLSAVRSMTSAADRLSGRSEPTIRILTMPGLINLFIASPLATFCAKYPDVKISLEVRSRSDFESFLVGSGCDLALTLFPIKATPDYEVKVLTCLCAQCVFPEGHELAKLQEVKASDLIEFPFISLHEGSLLRARIDDTFNHLGLVRNLRVEGQSQDVVCEMVAAGMGVSLILPSGVRPVRHGLAIRPFVPPISMEYVMFQRIRSRANRPPDTLANMIVTEVERGGSMSNVLPGTSVTNQVISKEK